MSKSIFEIFKELKELFNTLALIQDIKSIELLEEIETKGNSQGLTPSLNDLSEIDLSPEWIKRFLHDVFTDATEYSSGGTPPWYNTISGGVNLKGIILRGLCLREANLEGACLEDADLQHCIMENAKLNGACLRGANISGTILKHAELKQVCLTNAKLSFSKPLTVNCFVDGGWIKHYTSGYTQLYNAKLMGADFFAAEINGVNFLDADCSPLNKLRARGCNCLRNMKLPIVTVFRAATIKGSIFKSAVLIRADFSGATIKDSCFNDANLIEANLARTQDLDKTDFREAKLYGAYLFDAPLENTKIWWEDLRLAGEEKEGKWLKAREVYLALKNYFKSIGRYEDASHAYIKEKQMERKYYFPSEEGNNFISTRLEAFLREKPYLQKISRIFKWLFILMLFLKLGEFRHQNVSIKRWRWLKNLVAYYSCGYGEMPLKPVVLMFIALIVFTFLHQFVYSLGPCTQWYDYIIFSLRCFVTMSFNDLQPINLTGKILASLEGLFGIGLLSLLMYTLGRRLSGV